MNDRLAPEDEYPVMSNGDPMEGRLRRLESAIAAIQDTKLMEERLLERVMTRVPPPSPPPVATPVPPEMMIEAGRAMLPGALSAVRSHFGAMTDPRNLPAGSYMAPRTWLLTDLLQEMRTVWVLFMDHRFRPSWTIRTVPIICLTIFVIGLLTLGSVVGTIVQYILNFILVIVSYKTLSREVQRYRQETASPSRGPDLP